jgi:hypothetical protein
MATDVARLSFDPARLYRGVVPQQGRVSLEAEQNEQRVIDTEERRAELIDIVGPVGTPDNGYAVSGGTGSDLTVGAGTMYVGGWRVELDEPLDVAKQPDWLDAPIDDGHPGREHVVLWLQDTDVTAVEDPALYEVALGGPDGAARTRLLQRVVQLSTDASTCAEALVEDRKQWSAEGLDLDAGSMELVSNSRLLVTWEGDPTPPNPCEPSSTGGYLGAENQCIRVQITAVNQDGTFDFVWGYDDASFLYRVAPDASTNPVLTLDRTPVDDFHRPRAGQAVQALRATAELQSTDGVVEGYVAALGGVVDVLAAPYNPDTKTVQFPSPLPAAYTDATVNPQLYLRIWEERVTGAKTGTPVSLNGTGMQVTVTAAGKGNTLHVDDFWCVGVRPATPTTVYPDRYLREPQPPDGPHQWICPLAVVDWQHEQFVILEDCRRHFKPLTELDGTGCCTVEVRPDDAVHLQAIIDKAIAGRPAADRADRVTVCFEAGRYELAAPLVLRRAHSNLTLRACNDAVVLAVAAGSEPDFGQGMFVLVDVDNVTITGFEFTMPQVPVVPAQVQGVSGGLFEADVVRAINAAADERYVSIAIRPINCAVLEVDNCLFRFSVGAQQTTLQEAQTMPRDVFGVGVFATGGLWGLRLTRNRFLHEPTVPLPDGGPAHLLVGYLHVQTVVSRVPAPAGTRSATKAAAAQPKVARGVARIAAAQPRAAAVGASGLYAIVDDGVVVDNEFHGLAVAVLVVAQVAELRVRDTRIKDCYGGVWILDAAAFLSTDSAGSYNVSGAEPGAVAAMQNVLGASVFEPVLVAVVEIASLYPLPTDAVNTLGTVHLDIDNMPGLRQRAADTQLAFMSALVARLAADHPAAPSGANAAAGAGTEFTLSSSAAASHDQVMIAAAIGQLARAVGFVENITTSLRLDRNSVDCAIPGDGATGPALLTYLPVRDTQSELCAVAVDANRLVSRRAALAAAVFAGTAATVNGNTVIGGTQEQQYALAVALMEKVAIVGNVVIGNAGLPTRAFPPPLDTWLGLNTVGL